MRGPAWFWKLVAFPVALFLLLRFRVIRATSRVEVAGEGAAYAGPAVYVNWHRHLAYLIVHHGERGRWMMVSPAPYMESIASLCRWLGLKLARGATGEGGREALGELRDALQRGESVVLAVDGPAGPPFVVRPGCIDLARQTGAPIIPVAYTSRRGRTVRRRWDKMLIPRPWDRIRIEYGAPIEAGREASDAVLIESVRAALSRLDPDCPP